MGVEYAYGDQFSEVKTLVDKVKDYTNLFVIGSPSLTFNRSALDQSCNYIYAIWIKLHRFYHQLFNV